MDKGKKITITVSEVVDTNGKPIGNIKGVKEYKNALIIFTDNALYTDKPEIFEWAKKDIK